MNTFSNLIRSAMLCLLFLTACDSGDNSIVQTQSAAANGSTIAFKIPDRIRTSQAVDLNATTALISTSAGDINLSRNGDQFEGSINVEAGSLFSFTMTISENIDGQNVIYATSTGEIQEPVDQDLTITINTSNFLFPDDDGDGASNLAEVEAGSNYANSFSTPDDPDGMQPTETAPGLVEFITSTFSVTEADGELTIPVTRTGGSDGRVTVRFGLNSETAIAGRDFNASSGDLIWEDGDSTPQNITVVVSADDLNDGEQTFTASLFSPTGGVAIGNGFARITLIDSTPPAQRGTIQLTSSQITVDENAGFASIVVERIGGSDGIVAIDYATNTGTASEDDFAVISRERGIVWADGEQGTRTINIPITNDTEVESAESFTLNLSNNIGGATLGLSEATITITDTTPVPVAGQLSLTQNSFAVSEGESVDIVVERLTGADGAASVEFTVEAGTADDEDFTASNGTLTWTDGDSSPRTITVNTLTDTELESAETVIVTLENATGATLDSDTATITINDATVLVPGIITLSAVSAAVAEGSSIDIDVTRTGGSDGEVTVDVIAPASAEYTVSPAQLVWADGESDDQTITFTAIEDDITDDTETVNISLANATGNAAIANNTIAVTVNDTSVPQQPTAFFASDGEWEACTAPFNTDGPSAFATQLSANEGRIVSCVKTCDISTIVLDDVFPGWGWNPVGEHSCTTARDAEGTYTAVPIYTPTRETVNLNLSTAPFTRGNSIWACINETRQNAEFNYVADQSLTIWYQFLDDGTYFYGSTQDGSQPASLLGPDVWSVNGRVLEIGHLNVGYRNTLFFPGEQTLHIHPTTDNRLSCTRETRPASAAVQ